MAKKILVCDTCGKEAEQLRRDVVDTGYNAINKAPMWNCEACYSAKRDIRKEPAGDAG
jgi:hypothetical protein